MYKLIKKIKYLFKKYQTKQAITNLFIVSNLNQLRNIHHLIIKHHINDCALIILYTKKNLEMPKLVSDNADKKLFKNVQKVLIPNNPNQYCIRKALLMKIKYLRLLNKYRIKTLYILSYTYGYSLLSHLAQIRNIDVIYVEEGLGTYNLKKYKDEPTFTQKIQFQFFGLQSFLSWANGFKKAYISYPELFKKQFQSQEYVFFFPKESSKLDLSFFQKNTINLLERRCFLYVDQKYNFDPYLYIQILLNILSNIAIHYNVKIFIKLHPGDNKEKIRVFKNICNKDIFVLDDHLFAVEDIIKYFDALIGVNSSSLIYSYLINKELQIFSISHWLLNHIPKTKKNCKIIEKIQKDSFLLNQFSHIKQLYITDKAFR